VEDVDYQHRAVLAAEKSGQRHRHQISREGLKAIQDYLEKERPRDEEYWSDSPALLLPASGKSQSAGRLSNVVITDIWNEACQLAHVKNRTPHSARHAMGRHVMEKTGNVAAVQRQLSHKNVAYSLQYARITEEELN
jgi:integrase